MKAHIKRYGWAIWTGGFLSHLNVSWLELRYYIIFIPLMILIEWKVSK